MEYLQQEDLYKRNKKLKISEMKLSGIPFFPKYARDPIVSKHEVNISINNKDF